MANLLSQTQKHAEISIDAIQQQCNTVFANFQRMWENKSTGPKTIVYTGIAILASVWLAATLISRLRSRQRRLHTIPSTPDLEKRSLSRAIEREPGGTL